MKFHEGLNVIIGANNSGKTGLLNAIYLLNDSSKISIDDFNKNNLQRYTELYTEVAPSIVIEYEIRHTIQEDNTDDESIIKLLHFMDMEDLAENRKENNEKIDYNITARVRASYSLDVRCLEDYQKAIKSETEDYESYLRVLNRYVKNACYSWSYTNGISETDAGKKAAAEIFDIRFIKAERTNEEVRNETKQEIESYVNNADNITEIEKLNDSVSKGIENLLGPSIKRLDDLFESENNNIGLKKGNVSITSTIKSNVSLADSYITEVKDTKGGYTLPLHNNGLGYNNLINIYMLIKLTEIKPGKDFRILCLEEPEAHLHPAMQYKLFKYLKELDENNDLNQQIFVTTHSSNITAVAGIDNMFMLAYDREKDNPDSISQSLLEQFTDRDDKTAKAKAKKHLTKFLDVTRSDMLFADKVILVEGISEKLLLPLFMQELAYPYEDEHVSIVEIGGKNFNYFVELFNDSAVKKKVLCITDKDFKWINFESKDKLEKYSEYKSYIPGHIANLKSEFPIDNLCIKTQTLGGRTFEDELLLANMNDENIAKAIFKKASSKTVSDFLEQYGFSLDSWKNHIDEIHTKSQSTVKNYLNVYDPDDEAFHDDEFDYEKLIFAELFSHYAEHKKGDIALDILTDETLVEANGATKISIPPYIKEGLIWLMK